MNYRKTGLQKKQNQIAIYQYEFAVVWLFENTLQLHKQQ